MGLLLKGERQNKFFWRSTHSHPNAEPKAAAVPKAGSKAKKPLGSGHNRPVLTGADMKTVPNALKRIHARLRKKDELLKLHLKHYHMTLPNFKRRTSHLQIPKDI